MEAVRITLEQIIEELGLELVTAGDGAVRSIGGGYASDLLSFVMSHARAGDVWVTLQAHDNVVAVAGLIGLAAVIITEGQRPTAGMIARAEQEGVVLLATAKTTFTVVAELAALGLSGGADGRGS